ncbi:hypothetical protein BD324DRAFT_435981 [Kockovaella imperatae]|uniref:Polynucleotide 5'-hydroxyl-kinase GRC3 n=1 Tax=Kockovaella imperatae TaxID=4999 RepID=A0A1Y1UGR4_9TREE|nr:hypothetical protein BD324DRAFT_435981 [Kockovaella imperatae]ORX37251.1 hypothetical protein BD324DRAFT_435981 [Kockovaella imperatae]
MERMFESKTRDCLCSLDKSGTFCITPVDKPVDMLSTTLKPGIEYRVFAPTSHPLPVITSKGSTRLQISELSTGVEQLGVPGFSAIWPRTSFEGVPGVALISDESDSPVYPYIEPESWRDALDTLNDTPVVMIRGPKRCGKSTFARAALNKLLEDHERVVWLECDLGQSEFSCGGVVGLWTVTEPVLGPAFTHPAIPTRAYHLGEYTPLSCPEAYISAIRQLIDYYRYEMEGPLVINTQGWIKGLGEDLLKAIESAAEPTHVFTFEAEGGSPPTYTVPLGGIHRILQPAPTSPLQARYTPSDFRILGMMSYLKAMLGEGRWGASQSWEVNIPGTIQNVYLVGQGSDGVINEDLELALNGALVGLLQSEPEETIYEPGRRPDGVFLGYGIIRWIQPSSLGFKVALSSPLPSSALASVNAIVKNGAMELPLCALLEAGEDVPFVDYSAIEGPGLERRRIRRNIMRKGM